MALKTQFVLVMTILISTACSSTPKETGPGHADFAPKLNRPEVHRVWVPDQISGDEYISGHWKFLIDRPAVWSKE